MATRTFYGNPDLFAAHAILADGCDGSRLRPSGPLWAELGLGRRGRRTAKLDELGAQRCQQ